MRCKLSSMLFVLIAIAVTGKAETVPSDGIIFTPAGSSVNYTQDYGVPYVGLTKLGDGTATIASGLIACPINLEAGTLNLPNVSVVDAGKAGAVTLYGNSILNASGNIGRAVDVALGGSFDMPTVNATGNLSLGDLSATTGVRLLNYAPDFSQITAATLNVGRYSVGLAGDGLSEVGFVTLAGGQLSSYKGIHVLGGLSVTGYGNLDGYFEFGESGGYVDVSGLSETQMINVNGTFRGNIIASNVNLAGAYLGSFSPNYLIGNNTSPAATHFKIEGPQSLGIGYSTAVGLTKPGDLPYRWDVSATPSRDGGYSQVALYGSPTKFVASYTVTVDDTRYSYQAGDIMVLVQSVDFLRNNGSPANYYSYQPNLARDAAGNQITDWSSQVKFVLPDSGVINKSTHKFVYMPTRRDNGVAVALVGINDNYVAPAGWTPSLKLDGTVAGLVKSFTLAVSGKTSAPVANWYAQGNVAPAKGAITANIRYQGNGLGMFNGNWAYFNPTLGGSDPINELIFDEMTNAKFAGVKVVGQGVSLATWNGTGWDAVALNGNGEADLLNYGSAAGTAWTGTGITGGNDKFKLTLAANASLDSVGLVFDREGAVSFTMCAVAVPEPATLALLGMGVLGLLGCAWRRRKYAELHPMMLVVGLLASGTVAKADTFGSGANQFTIDFVNISGATNPTSGYGIVNNDYRMGTYEVTNDQWNKFTIGLGAPVVGNEPSAYDKTRYYTGPNVPIVPVSWYEAAQFVNWLNTSTSHQAAYKFAGTQGTSDYTFTVWASTDSGYDTHNLYRNSNAFYFLPTEDEWVKAAYWNGATLQDYATTGDVSPTQGDGNRTGWNYHYNDIYVTAPPGPWDVGSGSQELNGTYDMMGNVWEWMESPSSDFSYGADSSRGLRGGDWDGDWPYYSWELAASARYDGPPAYGNNSVGFRVASVPEPGSITLLVCGAIAGLVWWRRRKA